MRVFAQFYTAQEYEQFLTNLERERELRLRLSELYRYRENGVTRQEECIHFEAVLAQSQTDSSDHWTEKKSVSIACPIYIIRRLYLQFFYFLLLAYIIIIVISYFKF